MVPDDNVRSHFCCDARVTPLRERRNSELQTERLIFPSRDTFGRSRKAARPFGRRPTDRFTQAACAPRASFAFPISGTIESHRRNSTLRNTMRCFAILAYLQAVGPLCGVGTGIAKERPS